VTENPYAPPKAAVAAIEPAVTQEAPFFAVSLLKLAVMSMATLGFYELFWFYRNWVLIKRRERSDILPFWRAFFTLFFCYQCFHKIQDHAIERKLVTFHAVGWLAAAWIILSLTWRLPEPYFWLGLLRVIPLMPVQALANRIRRAETPEAPGNSRFTIWNLSYLGVVAVFLILVAIGRSVPDQPE
jgi:hypothetical protein